jgi:NAD(P)-dependent dehydrogenase (short-subunit alcohol dehydrogenase family)
MLTFENKVALITGAASRAGIGFAIARKLGLGGAKIVVSDVRGDEIQLRADELAADGCQALGVAHDVTSESDWTRVSRNLLDRFGKLDILVNNAGIAELKQMDVMTLTDWSRHIAVNLTSVYLGCHMALKEMRRAGSGGAIIN